MLNSIHAQWKTTLQQQNIQTPIGNWISNLIPNVTMLTRWSFSKQYTFRPIIDECSWALFPPSILQCFHVSANMHVDDTASLKGP